MAWNCRGESFLTALRHLSLLIKTNQPDILILVETRCPINVIDKIMNTTQFNSFVATEVVGFYGCIWTLWNSDDLTLDCLSVDEQIINVVVRYHSQQPWLLSAIYASPNHIFRRDLWDYLSCMGQVVDIPWLLVGNFNQILWSDEKKGGLPNLKFSSATFCGYD